MTVKPGPGGACMGGCQLTCVAFDVEGDLAASCWGIRHEQHVVWDKGHLVCVAGLPGEGVRAVLAKQRTAQQQQQQDCWNAARTPHGALYACPRMVMSGEGE